jgi:endonuclease/exonuclease/phosphatase family metal-dependent hydrolase
MMENAMPTCTVGKTPITDYRIIYAAHPAGLIAAANRLKDAILERFGIALDCICDTDEGAVANEILIGKTNRELSVRLYDEETPRLMSYRTAVRQDCLLIAVGGAFSAMTAVNALVEAWDKGEQLSLQEGDCPTVELLSTAPISLTEGSNLRVMTSNILAHRWVMPKWRERYPVVEQRAELYAAMLAIYRPDIIGVQETDAPWLEHLPYYLEQIKAQYGMDYVWTLNRLGDIPIFTSMIYNNARFVPVDGGCTEYTYVAPEVSARYKLRVLTQLLLRDRNDGRLYAHFNTHSGGTNDLVLGYEIPTMLAKMRELKVSYPNAIIFATGDFNNHGGTWYDFYKIETHLIDSREAAEANGTLVNKLPGIPEQIYIDHAFTNLPAETVTRWETVNLPYAENLSDHRLQYGDYCIR